MQKKPNIKLRWKSNDLSNADVFTQEVSRSELKGLRDSFAELIRTGISEHYKPRKKQISIRLDADVLEWFQAQPGKYQSLINRALRAYMQLHKSES